MSGRREFKDGKMDCALCPQQTSTGQASQQSSPVRARPTRCDRQPKPLAWCCPGNDRGVDSSNGGNQALRRSQSRYPAITKPGFGDDLK